MSTATLETTLTLDDLKENPGEHLRRLKQSGQPETLIVDGQALIVQDAAAYDRLWEAWDRLDSLEKVREAMAQVDRGEMRPAEEFFTEFERRRGIAGAAR